MISACLCVDQQMAGDRRELQSRQLPGRLIYTPAPSMYVWSGLELVKAALLVARGVACEERESKSPARAGRTLIDPLIIIGVLEQEKKY